jgi:hypothetical protein
MGAFPVAHADDEAASEAENMGCRAPGQKTDREIISALVGTTDPAAS